MPEIDRRTQDLITLSAQTVGEMYLTMATTSSLGEGAAITQAVLTAGANVVYSKTRYYIREEMGVHSVENAFITVMENVAPDLAMILAITAGTDPVVKDYYRQSTKMLVENGASLLKSAPGLMIDVSKGVVWLAGKSIEIGKDSAIFIYNLIFNHETVLNTGTLVETTRPIVENMTPTITATPSALRVAAETTTAGGNTINVIDTIYAVAPFGVVIATGVGILYLSSRSNEE